jgi:putative ABC transport system permease protein
VVLIAVQNVWAHKRRLLGALVAVTLGVAFLAGTLLLSDTLRANFSNLFVQANGRTDVVVRGAIKVGSDERTNTRIGVPVDLLPLISAQAGVADAQPYLQGFGRILGSNGKSFVRPGPPTFAANWVPDTSLNPYQIVSGRAPASLGEAVINRGAAKLGHLHLGQATTILVPQPVRVRIVGLATFGSADGFGTTTFAGLTLSDAERYLTSAHGQVNEILVKATPGTAPAQLAASLQHVLPAGVQTITGARQGQENLSEVNKQFLRFLRGALVAFAVIALLVGAFSIHNTFSVLAAQRAREAALLRALGASRRQVLGAAAGESAAVGVIGSVVGLAVGMGVAGLLKGLFDSFGFALPAGGLQVRPSSLAVAAAVGVAVTLIAGAAPALGATRVPPLAAVRDVDTGARQANRRRRWTGAALTVAGVGAAVVAATIGHHSGNVAPAAAGVVLVMVGAVLLGPAAAGPTARLLGAPVAALRGITGTLARENAVRQPRRTAGSASPLLIGVAVVALFTVVAASVKASVTHQISQLVAGDLVIGEAGFGSGPGTLSPHLVVDVQALPQVQAAAGIGGGAALLDGTSRGLTVADPKELADLIDLHVVAGPPGQLAPDQIAVSQQFAERHHWPVGTTVDTVWPDGTHGTLHVAAVYTHTAVVNDLIVTPAAFTPHDAQALDAEILVKLRPGANLAAAQAAVTQAAAPYGQPSVRTRSQYKSAAASGVNTVLGLVYAMLVLSIIIALLGIANTLSLSIHERTRELGLLRAVGQTKAQARSMVRWEAVIVSLFGTAGGLGCGLLLGWALVQTASGSTMSVFAAPVAQVVIIALVGALAGVLAAVRPARRAARLQVIRALAIT